MIQVSLFDPLKPHGRCLLGGSLLKLGPTPAIYSDVDNLENRISEKLNTNNLLNGSIQIVLETAHQQ